jgi:hypothetical protein
MDTAAAARLDYFRGVKGAIIENLPHFVVQPKEGEISNGFVYRGGG